MRKPSATLPIAVAALAIGGIAIVNTIATKNRPRTINEIEQEEYAEKEKAQKAAEPNPSLLPASPPPGGPNDANELALHGPEFTLKTTGTPKNNILVAYTWTPELQGDPSLLIRLARELQEITRGDATIRFVDTDTDSTVASGIFVNGSAAAPADSAGNFSANAASSVSALLKKAK